MPHTPMTPPAFHRRALGLALCAALAGSPLAAGEPGPPLRIAAASDLRFALAEVIAAHKAAHPGARVEAVYGASGSLYAQVVQGAPFDLFLSADTDYPRRLAEAGRGDGPVFVYALGRLAVWVPEASPLRPERDGLRCLLDPAATRVALANPRHAPYGRAAERALRDAGLHDAVRARLVFGENAAQAAQFAQSGAAQASLIPLALALAPELRAQGRHGTLPEGSHPRLAQGGLLIAREGRSPAAAGFRDLLLSTEGRARLARFGLEPPPEAP